jgi:uncharacterized protein DUF5666
MSAIEYDSEQEGWDGYDEEQTLPFPGRRRRQFWGRGTAVLLALALAAIGFYAGIRVEKGQLASSTTTLGTGASGSAAGGRAARLGAGAGAGSSGAAGGRAAALGGGGGFLGGGGNASFGTVSSVNGNTIYVQTATGNVVKVTLSSATKLTKSQAVSKSALRPGDTVVVQGVTGSGGTISATSVSDSGARASAGGSGGSGSGGSGGSGSRGAGGAVNSLFGGSGAGG